MSGEGVKKEELGGRSSLGTTGKGVIGDNQTETKTEGHDALTEDLKKGLADLANLKGEIAEAKKSIDDTKKSTIEVLAFFVALFTFVSVDIQVFKSDISALSAAGFTLLMLAGLGFFVVLLVNLIDDEKLRRIGFGKIFWFIGITALIGVGLIAINHNDILSREESEKTEKFYIKAEVDKIASSTAEKSEARLKSFKGCLLVNSWKSCLTK